MSTIASTPVPATSYPWPADVLAYTEKHKVTQLLEPLLHMVKRLFPTAEVKVSMHVDPELHDTRWVEYEIWVPRGDMPDFLDADRRLGKEQFRICAAPLVHHFVLLLRGG
jgi:hypothetical protein